MRVSFLRLLRCSRTSQFARGRHRLSPHSRSPKHIRRTETSSPIHNRARLLPACSVSPSRRKVPRHAFRSVFRSPFRNPVAQIYAPAVSTLRGIAVPVISTASASRRAKRISHVAPARGVTPDATHRHYELRTHPLPSNPLNVQTTRSPNCGSVLI